MVSKKVRYVWIIAAAVFLGILATQFGNLMWATAQSNYSSFPPLTEKLFPALIEPITTKLIPAFAVVSYIRLHKPNLQQYASTRVTRLAVGFGAIAGLVEFALYLLLAILVWLFQPVSFAEVLRCRIPPIFLHTVTGTLVTLPVLSAISYRMGDVIVEDVPLLSEYYPTVSELLKDRLFVTIILTTLGILLAQLVHVWWNTGGGSVVGRLLKLPC